MKDRGSLTLAEFVFFVLVLAGIMTLGFFVIRAAQERTTYVVVNIHNSNGSITPVTLQRVRGRWVGPRGEFYLVLPTPEQLWPVYGF